MYPANFYDNLFNGARSSTDVHAKELKETNRRSREKAMGVTTKPTTAGKKFRRLHPYAHFVLDFYCPECQLAIELNGSVYKGEEAKTKDAARTQFLTENKITVLRFWNSQILNEPEKVLEKIAACL